MPTVDVAVGAKEFTFPWRAALMLGGGLASIASALVADVHASKRLWPSSAADLKGLDMATSEAMITFSGLGSLDGVNQARHIARVFPGSHAYWQYSTDHISVEELAEILLERAPSLQTAGVNGHSMGGPLGLEVIRLSAAASDMKLGTVVLHCSPFDMDDARQASAAKWSALAKVPPGPGAKYLIAFAKGCIEGESVRDSIKHAKHHAVSGVSPRLWLSQMRLLQQIDLTRHMRDYQALVGPDTKVLYCMPDDPARDTTVDTERASQHYKLFFEALGVPFTIVRVPKACHADVALASVHLLQASPDLASYTPVPA